MPDLGGGKAAPWPSRRERRLKNENPRSMGVGQGGLAG